MDSASDSKRDALGVGDQQAEDVAIEAPLGDWAGWRRIPGFPVDCPLDVAIDPAAVVPAIKWIPCTDGRPSCEEIDGTAFSQDIIKFPTGEFSMDGRAFILVHYEKNSTIAESDVFDSKTLAPLAAWRVDYSDAPHVFCFAQPAFSPTQMGVIYLTALDGADGGPIKRGVDFGSPTQLMAQPKVLPMTAVDDSTSSFELSDSTFAFNMSFSAALVRGVTGTSTTKQTSWSYQLVPPLAVIGDDVFALNQQGTGDGWYREAHVEPDAAVTILREATQRHITAMVTDSKDWYWVESYGLSNPDTSVVQPNVEVYTAPFTNSSSVLDLTKKKIGTLPAGLPTQGVAAPGHYMLQAVPGQNEIFRASDGHRTSVANQGTGWCWSMLFATDTEFWCIERAGKSGANGVKVTKTHLSAW